MVDLEVIYKEVDDLSHEKVTLEKYW